MPDRILVPLIIATALFMENLDATVISTALPAIARDFGTSPIDLKLALTSYLLSIAVFIPASGWFADRYGARLVFRLAIVVFVAGSILCGLSGSVAEITAARVVQGIGGAMMVPVGRLVLLRSVSKSELVRSLAWLTIPALIGPIMGPPVGGFLTTFVGWQWIFWINVPVGILGLVLATAYIPDVRGQHVGRFDILGFGLSGLGLAAFMTGSTALGLGLFPPLAVLATLGTGAALLLAYVLTYRRRANPIIDLSLVRIPTFGLSLVGSMLFRTGIGATPFLLPLLLQLGFGMSPFASGMTTFAAAIGAVVMKFFTMPILRRFGFRNVLLANTLVASTFVFLPGLFTSQTPVLMIAGLLLIGGFFRSLQFTSVNALAFADVPPERLSSATTLTSVAQQLALTIVISIGALVLEASAARSGGEIGVADFLPAFLTMAVIAMAAIVPFVRLAGDAGDEMSGRQPAPDPVTAMRDRG